MPYCPVIDLDLYIEPVIWHCCVADKADSRFLLGFNLKRHCRTAVAGTLNGRARVMNAGSDS
jgi:hypothetical protein